MSLSAFYILCRFLHFAALIALLGSAAFTAWLAPPAYRIRLASRLNRVMCFSAWLALITAVLLLTAQTGLMGSGWQDMTRPDIWRAVLGTKFGQAWQWQLVAALAGVIVFSVNRARRQALLLASAVAQLAGLAFVGHASMHEGALGMLHHSNQIIHLISAAFWAGGLLPVIILMQEARLTAEREAAIHTMMRFSRYGHLAVALVMLSGIVNSVLILGWPLTRFQLYSQLMWLKAALVALMCLLATFNRYWLVPRFSRDGAGAQRVFIKATQAEIMLSVMVVALVSVFATLAPG